MKDCREDNASILATDFFSPLATELFVLECDHTVRLDPVLTLLWSNLKMLKAYPTRLLSGQQMSYLEQVFFCAGFWSSVQNHQHSSLTDLSKCPSVTSRIHSAFVWTLGYSCLEQMALT